MSRVSLGGLCGFLGILVTVVALTLSLKAQPESSSQAMSRSLALPNAGDLRSLRISWRKGNAARVRNFVSAYMGEALRRFR
jgi:hypothetical protein